MKKIPELEASPFAPLEVVDAHHLSPDDQAVLEKEEAIIRAGRRSFLEVASALVRVRDYKGGLLYQERYRNFEDYCRERWEFGRSYAYRLIGAAEIVAELSPRGENAEADKSSVLPSSEKQVRALSLLASPEDRRKAWTEAVEQAGAEEEVPAGLVSRVVRNLVAQGAQRRSKPRADQTEVMTYRITAKKLKKIRVFLGLIRAASGNSRGHIGIGKYVETIDELLPG